MSKPADMLVRLKMYPTDQGGMEHYKLAGWGCPAYRNRDPAQDTEGYSVFPKLGDQRLEPGTEVEFEVVFLSPQGALNYFEGLDHFYLWNGRCIGEAKILAILRQSPGAV